MKASAIADRSIAAKEFSGIGLRSPFPLPADTFARPGDFIYREVELGVKSGMMEKD
jgi:hypothetical protein